MIPIIFHFGKGKTTAMLNISVTARGLSIEIISETQKILEGSKTILYDIIMVNIRHLAFANNLQH